MACREGMPSPTSKAPGTGCPGALLFQIVPGIMARIWRCAAGRDRLALVVCGVENLNYLKHEINP